MQRTTRVEIRSGDFYINGEPTYPGVNFGGHRIEGLLMNSRMVQATFDDLNESTRHQWAYPDGPWDPGRNVSEFVAAMPSWREKGLLAVTLNLQGGNPRGYVKDQEWHNSAFLRDGSLHGDFMARMERVLDAADTLGMAVILGVYYFAQDQRLESEEAVCAGMRNVIDWLVERSYTHVLIEIANEIGHPKYAHDILSMRRCPELMRLAKEYSAGRVATRAGRLLVSVSTLGGVVPPSPLVAEADFLLPHGNSVEDPERIRAMVDQCRDDPAYTGQPIVFNEDDHFDFEKDDNNMLAAVSRHASWGYFDYRMEGEGFEDGYQSVPANWGIGSARKRGFFELLARVTGS